MVKKVFLITFLCLFICIVADAAGKTFTLVIDPGHGGRDIGAPGRKTNEKTINLNVALAFGKLVERNCKDVKVIYTRKTDIFVPLYARAKKANQNKADLFISIHTNAVPRKKIVRGMETYTLGMHRADDNLDVAKRENDVILMESDHQERYQGFDPNSSESYIIFEFMQDKNMEHSVEMARLIQQRTVPLTGRLNKGVKQAGFLVLRETSMPSCLVELGFISTRDEEEYMRSKKGVDNYALGLYRAFVEYKKKYYGGTSGSGVVEHEPDYTPEPQYQPEPESPRQTVVRDNGADDKPATATGSRAVFKVQILASPTKLKTGDKRFKGQKNVSHYRENGMYKYTVGSSEDYNEINRLRRTLSKSFKEAFVIAFKDGKRTDVQAAIREFKARK